MTYLAFQKLLLPMGRDDLLVGNTCWRTLADRMLLESVSVWGIRVVGEGILVVVVVRNGWVGGQGESVVSGVVLYGIDRSVGVEGVAWRGRWGADCRLGARRTEDWMVRARPGGLLVMGW